MAQGFVANSNLIESNSFLSDKTILDNLGGGSISDDIRLFMGNNQHLSRLINTTTALGENIAYGNFVPSKKYKIVDLGDNRSWTGVGYIGTNDDVEIGDIFTAINSGDGLTGTLGSASELFTKREFNSEFAEEGWTIIVPQNRGRVAFTQGTVVSIDGGLGYNYQVVNSDGITRFQLASVSDPANIWDLDSGNGPGNVDDLQIIRRDIITTENLYNANVTPTGSNISLAVRSDAEDLEKLSPDPYGIEDNYNSEDGSSSEAGSGIPYIQSLIDNINFKKESVILTYKNNRFFQPNGVRFDGAVRVVNNPDSTFNKVLKIGIDTEVGDLVVGSTYRITSLGTSVWSSVGANNLLDGLEAIQVSSSTLTQGIVYKILDLGHVNVGTNGEFTLNVVSVNDTDLDDTADTLRLITADQLNNGEDHGLITGDKVRYNFISGNNLDSGMIDSTTYYVSRIDGQYIKLASDPDDIPNTLINFTLSSGITGVHKITADVQADWNYLAGTSSNPVTYSNGDFFTATNLDVSDPIAGSTVSLIEFRATAPGTLTGTSGTAKALQTPGLFILNPANGQAKRAFTGTDNPWVKQENRSIDIVHTSEEPMGDNFVDSSQNPLTSMGVTGTYPNSLDIEIPFLTTTSDVAQAGDFTFSNKNEVEWGDFIVGQSYTISDLGSNRHWGENYPAPTGYSGVYAEVDWIDLELGRTYVITHFGATGTSQDKLDDWNYVAGTSGLTYAAGSEVTINTTPSASAQSSSGLKASLVPYVGMGFMCTNSGPSAPAGQTAGSGGKAIAEPKILLTNNNQTQIEDSGLKDDDENFSTRVTQYTHKIPIVVNGEEFYLLAVYEYDQIPYSSLQEGQEVTIQSPGSGRDWLAIGSDSQASGTVFTVNDQVSANASQGSGGTVTLTSGAGKYKVLTNAT